MTERSKKIDALENIMRLSEVDRQIIAELISNPRKSLSEIAKSINKNRATVTKKFQKMIESGVIKISIELNLNYYNNDFFLLRINLKSLEYAEDFFQFLRKCPKVIYVAHSFIDNSFLLILRDEKHEAKSKYFSCMHLIEQIEGDSRVDDCNFETLLSPIAPNFITLDEKLLENHLSEAPCGRDCASCMNYLQSCTGCPATKYYKGKLKFTA